MLSQAAFLSRVLESSHNMGPSNSFEVTLQPPHSLLRAPKPSSIRSIDAGLLANPNIPGPFLLPCLCSGSSLLLLILELLCWQNSSFEVRLEGL